MKPLIWICMILVVVGLLVGYLTHRVPSEAPFETATVCVNHQGETYTLMVGSFSWQKNVTPKLGYAIHVKYPHGEYDTDRVVEMKSGESYEVRKYRLQPYQGPLDWSDRVATIIAR